MAGFDTAERAELHAERAQDALDAKYMRGRVTAAEYARGCRRIAREVERSAWQRTASADHFSAVARRAMEG